MLLAGFVKDWQDDEGAREGGRDGGKEEGKKVLMGDRREWKEGRKEGCGLAERSVIGGIDDG